MTLARWFPNRVRAEESPDLVTSRNFEGLAPVLGTYASLLESHTTLIGSLGQKLARLVWPSFQGFSLRVATNSRMGSAVLVAGTVTVANTSVTANTFIYLSRATAGGTLGHLSCTQVAGTSFTITSSSGTDTSTINWLMVEAF